MLTYNSEDEQPSGFHTDDQDGDIKRRKKFKLDSNTPKDPIYINKNKTPQGGEKFVPKIKPAKVSLQQKINRVCNVSPQSGRKPESHLPNIINPRELKKE